jgi:hypothetical protein
MRFGGSARRFGLTATMVAFALIAAACASGSNASKGSSGLSVRIASPADDASVSEPFTVKLDASVPLGEPGTGEHHVHLCFDGGSCDTEYTLVYGDSIPVKGLSPGRHTIEVSLRNADHSDAGAPTDSVTVMVTGGASSSSSPDSGYGY